MSSCWSLWLSKSTIHDDVARPHTTHNSMTKSLLSTQSVPRLLARICVCFHCHFFVSAVGIWDCLQEVILHGRRKLWWSSLAFDTPSLSLFASAFITSGSRVGGWKWGPAFLLVLIHMQWVSDHSMLPSADDCPVRDYSINVLWWHIFGERRFIVT